MTTKSMSYKNIRSPAPVHKRKPSHGPHGLVRSSGYGKPSLLSKQSFPVSEKKTPKEIYKKTCMKAKSPADRAKSKGNFKSFNSEFESQRDLLFMLCIKKTQVS